MMARIRGWTVGVIAGLALGSTGTLAQADAQLSARYGISMIGVSIGQLSWTLDIAAGAYTTAASGKASGPLSMLVNGEGRVATIGTLGQTAKGWRLTPTFFSSNVTEDGVIAGLQMTLENGSVKTLRTDEPLRNSGRIPVKEADRHGISDPLTAMLIETQAGQALLDPAHCNRLLAIFDGQRRYDLAMSFKRADVLKVERGYAGPVLVCGVVLHPIAGYRADSMLVKYVSGRQGMEIWFAPAAGLSLIAPVRLVMPTMIGTLEIDAVRFETTAPAASGSAQPKE